MRDHPWVVVLVAGGLLVAGLALFGSIDGFGGSGEGSGGGVAGRESPDAEAVEARIEETREELLNEKRRAQTEAWIDARRTQLLASGELAVNQEAIRAGR